MLRATESQEAQALTHWVSAHGLAPYWAHIPNEGKRSLRHGAKLKREGLKAGVSDYFLATPMINTHGLWIELKSPKGKKPTAEQEAWLQRMRLQGYAAFWAKGWVNAAAGIYEYLCTGFVHPDLIECGVHPSGESLIARVSREELNFGFGAAS